MTGSPRSYFDPEILARLQNLRLRARTVAEGFIGGRHASPFRGHSLEFAEHREYAFGDELRHIDWKVYGRNDRFFIKQYDEETHLRVLLVLDASGSMGFRGEKSALSKYDYGATLAASLAYIALQQGDSAGLSILQNAGQSFVPPRGTLSHLNTLADQLVTARPSGPTDISKCLESLARSVTRRSMIILISDLLDDSAAVLKGLKLLRFKKHEVTVLHLLDRAEKDFDFTGQVRFESLEGQDRLVLDADSYRREYAARVEKLSQSYRTALETSGMAYHFHATDEPLDRLIRSVLRTHH
ncbi:MAG: hypothetical protein A3A86_02510 [Elusimicrobia bacterium RIFCSPLOWO2_01_FULL_60_11]|nr:MAG: hypothetical protein A3A86_02510 [Elusimicrobia bacterium RIFCSPLOWO2_01_FULL_60_11]